MSSIRICSTNIIMNCNVYKTLHISQVHTLLLYTLVGALACTFLEMAFKHQVLPALGRAYFTIIQVIRQ